MLTALIAASRLAAGSGWELLPLMAVGPAVAAAIGGVRYTLAAGIEAMALSGLFLLDMQPGSDTHRSAIVVLTAVAGVTAAGMLASWARERRDRQLAQVRLVAEAAQRVVLRPVPDKVGAARFAARYLSAASQARVGGDLYEVAHAGDRVRLIVGDAEGKGLPALQSAAEVLGAFREAAHEEGSLIAIVDRIERSLARRVGTEQFVTAVLAEISKDGAKMELISCGHPAPLLLGVSRPQVIGCPASLPLGLTDLAEEPRIPVTIPLAAGDEVLFYTDGATEARNKSGEFFPLADCESVCRPHCPENLVDQLSGELTRHVGHAPDDDIALLLVYRDRSLLTNSSGPTVYELSRAVSCLPDRAATRLEQSAGLLTDLDAARGDADHGVNMQRGFAAVAASLAAQPATSPGDALAPGSIAIRRTVGGTSGPLWSVALRRMAKSIGDAHEPGLAALASALEAAVARVSELGGAQPGEGTMLDALAPAAHALRAAAAQGTAFQDGLRQAAEAA